MARSFQITSLFPQLTAREHVELALQSATGLGWRFWRSRPAPATASRARAVSCSTSSGWATRAETLAGSLAYGRKRALELAIALALDPQVLLLDEPTAGMGLEDVDRTVELIAAVRERPHGGAGRAQHERGRARWPTGSPCCRPAGSWSRARTSEVRADARVIRPTWGAPPMLRIERTCRPGTARRRCCATSTCTSTRGEVVTLCGRNGAGKTTLLRCVMGLHTRLSPARSSSTARTSAALPATGGPALGLGWVPDDRGMYATPDRREHLTLPPVVGPDAWSLERVYEAFPALYTRRDAPATKLSGGEQQMLALARVLRMGARLLLCDEPTEGLSPLLVAAGRRHPAARPSSTASPCCWSSRTSTSPPPSPTGITCWPRAASSRRCDNAEVRRPRAPNCSHTSASETKEKLHARRSTCGRAAMARRGDAARRLRRRRARRRRRRSSPTTRSCSACSTTSPASTPQLSGKNSVEAVKMADRGLQGEVRRQGRHQEHRGGTADHQNKPDVANTRAAEMYDRSGVDAILDVPTSSAALTVADIAKQKKKLYFNISAATTDLTGKSCNKYTFHYAYDTYDAGQRHRHHRHPGRREELVHRLPQLRVRPGHGEELHRGHRRRPAARSWRATRRRSRTTTSPRTCSRRRR